MSDNGLLAPQEKRIFSRQIALPEIGEKGQETLKKAKVLVIGAGGKGTSVLQLLAKAGVGELGISDNYLIEEEELPRQMVYGCKDLGKLRAIAVKDKIVPANNYVKFNVHNICLAPENIQSIIKPYDVVVDATDNFPARYLINDAAILNKKPYIYGAIHESLGMVSVFNYQQGPSFRCLYPHTPKDKQKPGVQGVFSWGILLNVMGSLMANETIKVILGKTTSLNGNLLKFNFIDYSISYEQIVKNAENFAITDIVG